MNAPVCPIHQQPARFRPSSEHIYQGRDYGAVYECPRSDCDCYVGVHPNGQPKGTLAGKHLRTLRMQAHGKFDSLWKPWEAQQLAYPEAEGVAGKLRRTMRVRAYAWLAEQLGMHKDGCHIAMMNEADVARAIEILEREKPTAVTVRAWAKQRKAAA